MDTVSSENGDPRNPEEVSCNLDNVNNALSVSLVGENDVELGKYLEAYKELYNFFVLLGGAFSFVASDVKTKIKILEELKSKNEKEFKTVATMMEYEMSGLLSDKKYVSGSRTLLRLHRGLDFLRQFLAEVYRIEENEGTGGVCRVTYDKTLANFHPWGVKIAAQLAMKLLPTKKDLLKRTTQDDPAVAERIVQIMPDMFKVMATVYQRVDDLYTTNKLHNLS